jgi:hypothetical protein
MELMMKQLRITLFTLTAIFAFSSCEDIIDVTVEQNQVKMVIDAFINNLDTIQNIRITKSIPYFNPSNTEPPVTNATVILVDSATFKIFPFIHLKDGNYQWKPNKSSGDTFVVGNTYALLVITPEDTLLSFTKLNPTVDRIDSIRTITSIDNGPPVKNPGRYAELFAKDRPEPGNYYWIKTFRNDTFVSEIQKLNISQDMGNGSQVNGDIFIYPKRFSGLNVFQRPYQDGDTVRVEVHSITQLAYFWFNLVVNENRNRGLFATPPVNIPNYCYFRVTFTDPSNPFSFRIKDPKNPPPVAGFFCMSDVRTAEIIVKE